MASAQAARVSREQLAGLFPPQLDGWTLEVLENPGSPNVPAPPVLRVVYRKAAQTAEFQAGAGAPGGARRISSTPRSAQGDAMASALLANGVQLTVTSATAEAPALEALLRAVGLDRAEALVPAAR